MNTIASNQQKIDLHHYFMIEIEKINAFLLAQRKINLKIEQLESIKTQENQKLVEIQEKYSYLEVCQKENFNSIERLFKNQQKNSDIEIRLNYLESFESKSFRKQKSLSKFGLLIEKNQRRIDPQIKNSEEITSYNVKEMQQQIQNKIIKIERELSKNKQAINVINGTKRQRSALLTNHSESTKDLTIENYVQKRQLKQLEKRIQTYFSDRFTKIQIDFEHLFKKLKKELVQYNGKEDISLKKKKIKLLRANDVEHQYGLRSSQKKSHHSREITEDNLHSQNNLNHSQSSKKRKTKQNNSFFEKDKSSRSIKLNQFSLRKNTKKLNKLSKEGHTFFSKIKTKDQQKNSQKSKSHKKSVRKRKKFKEIKQTNQKVHSLHSVNEYLKLRKEKN